MAADLDTDVPKKPANGRRFKQVPLRFLLPNLITLLALCSGITAIRLGIEGRYELAVGAIIVSIVLDAVDGRLARFLKGTSRFGAELDSLADFVNFGVAPAILIYLWALNGLRTMGWVVALILAICCALRLARFNVALDDLEKPAWSASFFSGAPAPAGAGLAMLPMYLGFLGFVDDGHSYAMLIAPYIVAVALLMVSRVPTYSGKTLRPRVRARPGAADPGRRRLGHCLPHRLSLGNTDAHGLCLSRPHSVQHQVLPPAQGRGPCRLKALDQIGPEVVAVFDADRQAEYPVAHVVAETPRRLRRHGGRSTAQCRRFRSSR